jgi:hypothetical protein
MLLQGALQARFFSLFRSPYAKHEDRSYGPRLYRTPLGVRYQPALGLVLAMILMLMMTTSMLLVIMIGMPRTCPSC